MTVVQQNSDEPLRSHPLQTPKPEDLSEEALRSQTPPPFRQGLSSINSSVDILPSNRKLPPQFPLSAFLKDLASPTERRERWPRSPPTPQPAIPWQETPPPPYTVIPSTTPAGPGAADATTGFPSCNAERTPEAVSVTWPSSSDTAATNKRPLAFDATPFTPASESIPATHTLLSTPPPPATTSPLFPVLGPGPSPLGVATTLPTSTVPLVEFSHPSMTQQVSTTRKPRLPALQRSSFSWHDTLEGNTVFRPSPAAMITAPITSPYPFVYPSRPWSPAAVSLDLSKNTASVQSMLRRRLALNCSSPEAQANLTTFLDMGHAKNCWCSKFNHGEPAKPADSTGTTLGRDALLEARSAGSDNSSSDAMEDTAHAPGFLGETEEDIDSDIAGHDGILILSATEDASSEFEELETIDGQPVNSDSDSDSDDEDWCAIPPRAHSPPSAPSPSSWTVSDVSARSSNASPVYELSAALPSPNRAPTVDTKRAHSLWRRERDGIGLLSLPLRVSCAICQ